MLTWEIVFVPALLCFLGGILAAMSWLEQELLGEREVVLLPVAEGGHPWVDDMSRSVG